MLKPPFQPGNRYGVGRPRGSRNKLASTVFNNVLQVWDEPVQEGSTLTRGVHALRTMAKTRPAEFIKACFGIMPREFLFESIVTELPEDELREMLQALKEQRQRVVEKKQPALIEHIPSKEPDRVH